MAPSTVAGQLLARSLSHGGIAGAVVGSVIGATVIFLLVLPFILRAIRDARYHRKIAAENAEMGITGPGFYGGPDQAYSPTFCQPGSSAAGSGVCGPAPQAPADPAATLGDNNSSEDGKAFASPSPPPPAAAAGADASAADSGPAAPARSALPAGSAPINTNIPPFAGGPRSASLAQQPTPPPTLNAAATFPTFGTQDPFAAPRQRSSTMRSTRSSSLSHTLEGFAGRAAAVFRQGSTRSTSTRSPTTLSGRAPIESARSPVEIGFDHFDPSNHHTWLMRQQGIDDATTGVDPSFFEVNQQYLTGASAEYYSGAPLSPPTDPSSSFMSPISYAPTPPSMIATSFASMASAAAVAGVASDSKKQPKPIATRTDSMRTITTSTDFSPLPLSPTSPLPRLREGIASGTGDRSVVEEDDNVGERAERGVSSPPAGSASVKTELTPEPVEFLPHSPSYRPLVPSPRLPAPGTVNPRDVWAPATDDERFVHKTAELDRIEQSPPPAPTASSSQPDPALEADAASSAAPSPSDHSAVGGAEVEEASETVVAPTQPAPLAEPSPEQFLAATSVSAPSDASNITPPRLDITPADDAADQFTPQTEGHEVEDMNQAGQTDVDTSDSAAADLQDFMLDDDYQGGINFAYGDGQQFGYMPNSNINNNNNNTYPLNGDSGMNDVSMMPQQNDAMYWNIPNGIPTITGPYMTPVSQGDFSNGMLLAAPFSISANGSDGMNGVNGMSGNVNNGGSLSQFPLHTPQSSPDRISDSQSNGATGSLTLPPGMALPLTPSPPKHAPNFNSPLSVPSSDIPSGPVSPLSNQGSTPGQPNSSPRAFACDECGRIFDQIHKLNHHKRYHERPHECTVPGCGKRFGTKTHLDRHVNDKHSKSRKYHCTEEGCPYSVPGGKSFPRKDNWRRHMVNKHGVHPDHEPIEVIDQPMEGMQ